MGDPSAEGEFVLASKESPKVDAYFVQGLDLKRKQELLTHSCLHLSNSIVSHSVKAIELPEDGKMQ
jgi:hypothetical protein